MEIPPKPDTPVKSEVELDVKSEPEYDFIVENLDQPDNVIVSELETEVQIKNEPEADAGIKNEPEADIEIKMELEADQEFSVGTKLNNFKVRILVENNLISALSLTLYEPNSLFVVVFLPTHRRDALRNFF